MHALFRTLGLGSWIGCILTLAFQAVSWVLSASWPSVTLLDVARRIFGFDLASMINSLPLELGVKTTYILITTELSIAFWWAGIFFFALSFFTKVLFGK